MGDKSSIEWTNANGSFNDTLYHRSRVKWSQLVWYGTQRDLFAERRGRERGREFELIAVKSIFPKVGLSEVIDLTRLVSNSPFDFLATLGGMRVAIDVSAKWQKRVDSKAPLAEAFDFPFYVLLISPRDPTSFFFTPVKPTAKSIRVPFTLLRAMANNLAEVGHGRPN